MGGVVGDRVEEADVPVVTALDGGDPDRLAVVLGDLVGDVDRLGLRLDLVELGTEGVLDLVAQRQVGRVALDGDGAAGELDDLQVVVDDLVVTGVGQVLHGDLGAGHRVGGGLRAEHLEALELGDDVGVQVGEQGGLGRIELVGEADRVRVAQGGEQRGDRACGVDSPPAVAVVEFWSRKAKNHTPAAATRADNHDQRHDQRSLALLRFGCGRTLHVPGLIGWLARAARTLRGKGLGGRLLPALRTRRRLALRTGRRRPTPRARGLPVVRPAGILAARCGPFWPPGFCPGFCGPPPWPGCGQPWGPFGPCQGPWGGGPPAGRPWLGP